jgi:hypothetical protein
MVSDRLVRDCSLAIGVFLFAKLDRRSRNSYDLVIIYESAIASTNVKINFARSDGVF